MKKIKIALVGLNFGQSILEKTLLQGIASPYFDVIAICDKDEERLRTCGDKHNLTTYNDLEDLLQLQELQAVCLYTGPNGRAKIIDQIFAAGKDVMTTKPFESDSKEAERIFEKAEEMGRTLYLNSPCSIAAKDIATIKAWQEEYNLGRLVAGRWEGWYKAVQYPDGSWYDDPVLCPAAPLFRIGVYGLNDIVQLFGTPKRVQVMQSKILSQKPTPDLAQMGIEFMDGAMVSMLAGWCMDPERGLSGISLNFENGTIIRNMDWSQYHGELKDTGAVTLKLYTAESGFGSSVIEKTFGAEESSHNYPWKEFYQKLSGELPEDTVLTKPKVVINAIKIIEAMKQASLGDGQAEVTCDTRDYADSSMVS